MPVQRADNGEISECTAAFFPDAQLLGNYYYLILCHCIIALVTLN
jgi:hypothetical protein